MWWLAGVSAFSVCRFLITRSLLLRSPHRISASTALASLVGLASSVVCRGRPLPIVLCDIDSAPHASYLVFILLGMATGSITQSLCYKWAGIAFAIPVFSARSTG